MKTMIEVEHRGILSKQKFEDLQGFFGEKGEFKGERDKFSIIFLREFVAQIKDVADDVIDLKVRVVNKRGEVVLKHGVWASNDARKEYSFQFAASKIESVVQILKVSTGRHWVILMANKTFLFQHKGIEFALVEVPEWGYYFEAEIMCNEGEEKGAVETLNNNLQELGLKTMSNGEYYKLLDSLNNRDGYKIDLEEIPFSELKKRFQSYF